MFRHRLAWALNIHIESEASSHMLASGGAIANIPAEVQWFEWREQIGLAKHGYDLVYMAKT
jgi:hypothetical protein